MAKKPAARKPGVNTVSTEQELKACALSSRLMSIVNCESRRPSATPTCRRLPGSPLRSSWPEGRRGASNHVHDHANATDRVAGNGLDTIAAPRFTVEQYEAMVDSASSPSATGLPSSTESSGQGDQETPHVLAGELLRNELQRIVPAGWRVSTEIPIRIVELNEPEPDVALVRGTAGTTGIATPDRPTWRWSSRLRTGVSRRIGR